MRRSALGGVPFPICVLLIGLVGCDRPKTLTPDLEIITSLPLLEERVEIGDRIAKADSIRVNPTDSTRLELRFVQDEVELDENGSIGGDRMNVPGQEADVVTASVGVINVDDLPPETTPAVRLADLIPTIAQLPPNAPFDAPETALPTSREEVTFGSIDNVTFADEQYPDANKVVVSVANHTPLTLGPVEVYLSQTGDTVVTADGSRGAVLDVIAQTTLTTVPPGDSLSATELDLTGVTLSSPVYTVVRATTQAGLVNTNDLIPAYMTVTVDISALKVVSADARIPEQTYAHDDTISFENEALELINVEFTDYSFPDTNRFTLNVINALPVSATIRYSLTDFTIPETPVVGSELLTDVGTFEGKADYSVASLTLGANENSIIVFDLKNAFLRNSKTAGAPVQEIQVNVETTINGTGDQKATIEATDSVRVETDLSALAIKRVEGRVPPDRPIVKNLKPVEFKVEQEVPSGLQGFEATEVAISMNIRAYQTEVTTDADIRLVVLDSDGATVKGEYNRSLDYHIEPGFAVRYRITEDSIGTQGHSPIEIINATLDNVFQHGRSHMNVTGVLTVGGDIMLVRDQSRLEVTNVEVISPLKFIVPGLTFDGRSENQKGFNPDVDSSAKDDIIPRVVRASLVANVESHFPVGGTLVMFASPDPVFTALRQQYPAEDRTPVEQIPDTLTVTPGVTITNEDEAVANKAIFRLFTIAMPEAQRDPTDGSVDHDNPGVEDVELTLSQEQIQLFAYDKLYLLPRVQLMQDPGLVKLEPQDYFVVSVWMRVKATTAKPEGN